MRSEKGESLMELVVVITVILIVTGALVLATISSLRNAQAAKNQSQATKYAQEGLEAVRAGRDRDGTINFTLSQTTWKNPAFWIPITNLCGVTPCYFKLSAVNLSLVGNGANFNSFGNFAAFAESLLNGQFARAIIIEDDTSYSLQKSVTSVVKWRDFSGEHESRLTTILRRL